MKVTTSLISIRLIEFIFIFLAWYVLWSLIDYALSQTKNKFYILIALLCFIVLGFITLLVFPALLSYL
jgi:hypothetical protein